MKIALTTNSAAAQLPEVGGGYTFEDDLIQTLLEMDDELTHEFWIYSLKEQNLYANISQKSFKNIKIIHPYTSLVQKNILTFKSYFKAAFELLENPQVRPHRERWTELVARRSIQRNKLDLVWSFSPNCLARDIPYVITIWDLQHRLQPFFPEVSREKEWTSREHFFLRNTQPATYIITGTNRGKEEIERFYRVDPDRIRVIPFPTPKALQGSNKKPEKIKDKYNISTEYLFYPAQFWPHKNHVGILNALKMLRDDYQIVMNVVFTGSDKGNLNYVKSVAEGLGLMKQVHFLGFIPREDLYGLYRQAFALLFLSFFGPDNLPPLEAFSCSCPVIAADVPGAKEQLGNAAILVSPSNTRQVALAIKQLKENPELRQTLVSFGQQRAMQWTGKDYIKAMLEILDEFQIFRYCWPS
ncbi:glycosyltransferase family 4 protein [Trichothermofontia sp.]